MYLEELHASGVLWDLIGVSGQLRVNITPRSNASTAPRLTGPLQHSQRDGNQALRDYL
jgi:hypothetical protein